MLVRLHIAYRTPTQQQLRELCGLDGGPLEDGWAPGCLRVQVAKRLGKQATVPQRLPEQGLCPRRRGVFPSEVFMATPLLQALLGRLTQPVKAAVQHLALFVSGEALCKETGDMNSVWAHARAALAPSISYLVVVVQLLRRSAEDENPVAK